MVELIHRHTRTETYRDVFVRTAPGVHQAAADLVEAAFPQQRRGDAKVLELGAGPGAFSYRLLDMGFKDLTAWELDAATVEAPVARAESVDLNTDFGARPDRFDLVVALEVIEHLENPWAFMRGCSRILSPGGLLVVSSPNVESAASRLEFLKAGRLMWFHDEDIDESGHLTPLGRWQVELAARRAGLSVEAIGSNSPDALVVAGRHPRDGIKSLIALAFYPFMSGAPRGEILVWALRQAG